MHIYINDTLPNNNVLKWRQEFGGVDVWINNVSTILGYELWRSFNISQQNKMVNNEVS